MSKMVAKIIVLREICDAKDILFAPADSPTTLSMKSKVWAKIATRAHSLGLMPPFKDFRYLRGVFWPNIRKKSLAKRNEHLRGREVVTDPIDDLVYEIIDNTSELNVQQSILDTTRNLPTYIASRRTDPYRNMAKKRDPKGSLTLEIENEEVVTDPIDDLVYEIIDNTSELNVQQSILDTTRNLPTYIASRRTDPYRNMAKKRDPKGSLTLEIENETLETETVIIKMENDTMEIENDTTVIENSTLQTETNTSKMGDSTQEMNDEDVDTEGPKDPNKIDNDSSEINNDTPVSEGENLETPIKKIKLNHEDKLKDSANVSEKKSEKNYEEHSANVAKKSIADLRSEFLELQNYKTRLEIMELENKLGLSPSKYTKSIKTNNDLKTKLVFESDDD